MNDRPHSRGQLTWIWVAAACIVVLCGRAGGEESVGKITVYSREDLAQFCGTDRGLAYIEFPGTARRTLLGREDLYRPMPLDEVVDALARITYPLDGIEADIVILATPRRDLPESSAEGMVVFLSPGSIDYPQEHVHYAVTHEIGHVVQHALMPDSRDDLWKQYASLRGIALGAAPGSQAHAARPHEIFAEDFRILFGGDLARCGSGAENHDLRSAESVSGLREFFLSLLHEWEGRIRIFASPNPFRDHLVLRAFSLDGASPLGEVTVYDAGGRVVRTITASSPDRSEIVWDARNSDGGVLAPGVYFIAIRSGSHIEVHKITRIPG